MTRKLTHYAMLVAAALLCLGLHSCSLFDDDDEEEFGELGGDTPPENLYGTWDFGDDESITFYEDGSGYMVSNQTSSYAPARPLQFTYSQQTYFYYRYSAETNRLVIVDQSTWQYSTWEIIKLTDTDFSFRDLTANSNGQIYSVIRHQDGEEVDPTPTPDDSFREMLCGKWWRWDTYPEKGSYARVYFYQDGTGDYEYYDGWDLTETDAFRWEYDPERGTLTTIDSDGEISTAYNVELTESDFSYTTDDGYNAHFYME